MELNLEDVKLTQIEMDLALEKNKIMRQHEKDLDLYCLHHKLLNVFNYFLKNTADNHYFIYKIFEVLQQKYATDANFIEVLKRYMNGPILATSSTIGEDIYKCKNRPLLKDLLHNLDIGVNYR
jgi:hypothetical protein